MAYYYENRGGFFSSLPPVTKNLFLINVVMFIFTLINQDFMVSAFALSTRVRASSTLGR